MRSFWIFSLLFSFAAAAAAGESTLKHVDVFVSGKDGYFLVPHPGDRNRSGRIASGLCRGAKVQPERPRRERARDRSGAQEEHGRWGHMVAHETDRARRPVLVVG